MPFPSTGTDRSAAVFNRVAGDDVTLDDGSIIRGILRTRTEDYELEEGSEIREFNVLWVATVAKGTLDTGQDVVIGGIRYYVASMNEDSDGWIQCTLSKE